MEIKEEDGKVIIDQLYGQIEREKYCSTCKFNLVYYDNFDTYFCPNVIIGLNLNVVTLIANIALIEQKSLYL